MANDLTLSVVLGASLASGFGNVFGKASKSVGTLGKAIRETHTQLSMVKAYQRNNAALDQTRAKLGETQTKVMALKKAVAAGDTSTKLARQLETTQNKAVKLSAALDEQRTKLRQEGHALRQAGIGTNDLNTASERLTTTMKRQQAALGRLNTLRSASEANLARRASLRGKLFGAVAGAAMFAAPVTAAVKFESTMADVRKVVNFDTPQQFKQMSADVVQLSTRLPMAAEGIGQIVAAGGQAGIARQELVAFARDAVKMGIAFDMSAEDAGQIMAKWRTGLQLSQEQAVQLGDVVNYLSNSMAATPAEIASIVKEVGPFAKTAGLSANSVAALGASMIAMGAESSVASTSLRRMFINLTAGEAATAAQQKAFTALGMNSAQVAKSMQKDAQGTILSVLAGIKQLPKAEQASIITQLFGAHAVQAVAPLLNNLDALKDAFHKAGDASLYTGSMQKEYDSRSQTTANNLQLLKNRATALGITLGNILLPTINRVAGVFGKGLGKLTDLAEKYPVLTKAVIGTAAALVAFRLASLAGGYGFTFLKGGVLGMQTRFEQLRDALTLARGGVRAFSLSLLANPIGLAIAGIALGAVLIFKYWQPIKAFFKGVWQGISQAAGPILDSIADALAPLKPLWDGIASGISAVFGWVSKLFQPFQATKDQLDGATSAGQAFGRGMVTVFEFITLPIQGAIKLIDWLGTSIGTAIGWVVVNVPKAADIMKGAWNGAISFVAGLWDGLKATVASAVDWIMGKVEWIANKWQTIKGLPGAVWQGIKGTVGRVTGTAVVGAALAAPAAAAAPMPAPANRNVTVTSTTNAPITIQAAPGMDEQALAKHVRQQLDERDRQQAARQRSTIGDLD